MKKYPEWINTPVISKALDRYNAGYISKSLSLWLEDLLELKEEDITNHQH